VTWTGSTRSSVRSEPFRHSIYIDPADGNHAWISYSGFERQHTDDAGHVFEVTYNPVAGNSHLG